MLDNHYRYAVIAGPVTLQAGTEYVIGAFVGNGCEPFLDESSAPFVGSGVTITENRLDGWPNGTFSFPGVNGGLTAGRWCPANALPIVIEAGTLFVIK